MRTTFLRTSLDGVLLVEPARRETSRGYVSATYCRRDFEAAGLTHDFVQEHHSQAKYAGAVHGLHFQRPPNAQARLVRVVRGAVLDVVLDLREGSPSFGRHYTVKLSSENGRQLLIPEGFAHGFLTLEPNTELVYKVSAIHSEEHHDGVFWADSTLGISWPIRPGQAIVTSDDQKLPKLADLATPFRYEEVKEAAR
jgi:dTDP-4-dehydrorhamnose 3,5-epimerase